MYFIIVAAALTQNVVTVYGMQTLKDNPKTVVTVLYKKVYDAFILFYL